MGVGNGTNYYLKFTDPLSGFGRGLHEKIPITVSHRPWVAFLREFRILVGGQNPSSLIHQPQPPLTWLWARVSHIPVLGLIWRTMLSAFESLDSGAGAELCQ